MTWKKERDLLMAQTMEFVRSVGGKTAAAAPPLETQLPSAPLAHRSTAEQRPVDVLPARLTLTSDSGLRDEIRRRVAAFRARQQAFARDRHEYCDAVMAKVHAASEEAAKASGKPILKR